MIVSYRNFRHMRVASHLFSFLRALDAGCSGRSREPVPLYAIHKGCGYCDTSLSPSVWMQSEEGVDLRAVCMYRVLFSPRHGVAIATSLCPARLGAIGGVELRVVPHPGPQERVVIAIFFSLSFVKRRVPSEEKESSCVSCRILSHGLRFRYTSVSPSRFASKRKSLRAACRAVVPTVFLPHGLRLRCLPLSPLRASGATT